MDLWGPHFGAKTAKKAFKKPIFWPKNRMEPHKAKPILTFISLHDINMHTKFQADPMKIDGVDRF